ncbi:SRPBCC family protein [Streptomyces sp. NPDC001407]|uniref:SRPBCC family protein n=1 Tax=Streptomyces sp. NPDC001407 TaxID=3364573 RepID=UPI00367718C1
MRHSDAVAGGEGRPSFAYVLYIESSAADVWRALTDAERTAAYWGHANVSDWQPGSSWEHRRTDGTHVADVVGTVLEATPPTRLVTTWALPGGERPGGPSRVTFGIEEYGEIVRLTVTHEDLADEAERAEAARGWAAVLSNLKTYLETGRGLAKAPWLMP